jgi:radical SAM protein with 4Fe4S-binding SPASM domain
MQLLRYVDFSSGVHSRSVAQRAPVNGAIEVTRRCPLRCLHCYNNLPVGDREARSNELTYEEHCRILDEISEAGCLWLLYTGGEIFVRKDFLDIYTYAKQKGLLITLFTNGTFLTEKVADYLAEWRPFSIEITLYGCTKETYEQVTGIPGSYRRCLQGIHLLMERNLPLKLKTMVLRENKHEIWEMKRFAEEGLGVDFRFDALINSRIDCSQKPIEVRLSPPEVVELDLLDVKRVAEFRKFCERFNGPPPPGQMDDLYHCGAGISSFAIDPYGMLRLCTLSNGIAFDLRKGPFREGWENYLQEVRQKKISRQTKCVHCELRATCGMCPPHAELEKGDAEEPVDFLCHVAHLRARVLGIHVPPHGECKYCQTDQPSAIRCQPSE